MTPTSSDLIPDLTWSEIPLSSFESGPNDVSNLPGSSQTWLFQTWLFALSTRKRSFALFCALLRSFALFCRLAFALICALLRAFLRTTAFRTTAFGNCRFALEGRVQRGAGLDLIPSRNPLSLGRAIHGPTPVSGRPLTNFRDWFIQIFLKTRHQGIGPCAFACNSYGPMAPKSL